MTLLVQKLPDVAHNNLHVDRQLGRRTVGQSERGNRWVWCRSARVRTGKGRPGRYAGRQTDKQTDKHINI